jgi:hypothetical protein
MKCLALMFVTCVFSGVMMMMAHKYDQRVCEVRYGAGENQTLRLLLEDPIVKHDGEQTCVVALSLEREELLREPSLIEQIWNTVAPSDLLKYRLLARVMLEKCGENVLMGHCCEQCVRYRLVTG